MGNDPYTAVWVSHSSIGDYVKCPRAYFLKNVYKDPKTGHKIQLMAPPLALGQAVHEVIESLSVIPKEKRFETSLLDKYVKAWANVTSKKGGFTDPDTEAKYKQRGEEMLRRVMKNPGPLVNLTVKISQELPHFWLSPEDNIILTGKIDWLEYMPDDDAVHIIDFKTSKKEEDGASLQLPIYNLLVHGVQKRRAKKASYWYLEWSDTLEEKELPDLEKSKEQVLKIAKQIKLARQFQRFACSSGNGCRYCRPMEAIVRGAAEFVGVGAYNRDIYILDTVNDMQETELL